MGKPTFLEGTLYSTCSKAGFKHQHHMLHCVVKPCYKLFDGASMCAIRSGSIMLCGFRAEEQLTQDLMHFALSLPVRGLP